MAFRHEIRRATADDTPRAAGLQLNTDQRVNDRIADLGDEAAARLSGGQGAYPPHSVNDNHNQFKYGISHHVTQPNYSEHMPLSHGNQLRGEFHPAPTKRISSGRDRTGSDNIARLFIPWPNEHCLIGVDRKQVTYDQLTQAQWHAGLMNILAMERNPLCYKTMINHITRLSQDVVDCGFPGGQGCACGGLGGPRGGEGELDGARRNRSDPTRLCLKGVLRSRGPRSLIIRSNGCLRR